MASADWQKIKSRQQVKAILRHNCKDTREQTKEHSNPHLRPELTATNTGLWDTYAEAVKRYDDRWAEVNGDKTVRKDAVVGLGFSTPAPDDLPEDKENKWFVQVLDIMATRYGYENIASFAVHRDERHEYIDPDTHERKMSRTHAQGILFPEADGTMCAKKIMTKGRMAELNRAIDEMSRTEFGVSFLTGRGTKSRGSVEEMKARSLQAEIEDLEKQKAALTREIEGKQITLNAVNRDIATGTATRDALMADLRGVEDRARKKATEAEKPLTEDDRAVIGEVRRRRTKMKNGKEMPTYDYYLDAARQREQAERQKEQEERERIARQAAEERQRQEKQAEYIKRYSGFAKKRQDTTSAGRKLPDISHITQRGDSYDGPEY